MISSTITTRGQTVLPQEVRDALSLEAGQKLVYKIKGDEVTITQHPGVMASFGTLKAGAKPWTETRKLTRQGWVNHVIQEGKAQ